MNLKVLLNSFVGVALGCLIAWKGASVAAAIVGALVALCTLVAVLHVLPPGAQAYVDALEAALEQNAPEAAKKFVKRALVLFLVLGALLAGGASVSACNTPVPVAPSNIITPAAACAVDIVEDVTVAPTQALIAQTEADCGITAADLYADISALISAAQGTAKVTTRRGRSVASAPYIAHLQAWQALLGGAQ